MNSQLPRRKFLKTAVAGAAAVTLPYYFSSPRTLADEIITQNDRMNVGVIGSGNIATEFQFKVEYPGGTDMIIRHDTDNGVLITGEKSRIFVNRGKLVGKPVGQLEQNPLPEDALSKVYKGLPLETKFSRVQHWANFLHCVRERKEPI